MKSAAIRHVSVWLDKLAPHAGAFAHALEWATRLGLPLRILDPALPEPSGRLPAPEDNPAGAARLRACETACRDQGVPCQIQVVAGDLLALATDSFHSGDLWVFAGGTEKVAWTELLRQSLHGEAIAPLVCPPIWQPLSRVLVLDEGHGSAQSFLGMAAELCQALQAEPVVLTIGRSEAETWSRQQAAETIFRRRQLAADFDLLVGCDVRTAVAAVARWRHCTHVFMEKRDASPWLRWLRGDTLDRLIGLSESLALLALPTAVTPADTAGAAAGKGPISVE